MFQALPRISHTAVADLLQVIRARLWRYLIRRRVVEDDGGETRFLADDLAEREPGLAKLAAAAVSAAVHPPRFHSIRYGGILVEACPRCAGKMKLIALVATVPAGPRPPPPIWRAARRRIGPPSASRPEISPEWPGFSSEFALLRPLADTPGAPVTSLLPRSTRPEGFGTAYDPGCTHTRFLHGHHIRHWLHGGKTSVDNLVLLCTAHHHLVHQGGWLVARTEASELLFTSPTGEVVPPEPPREPIDDALAWLHEWAVDRGLDLGPDANEPLWDGTQLDYDYAVSALLAAGA